MAACCRCATWPGQEIDAADRPQQRPDAPKVLSREHLGRSHDHRLVARLDRDQGRGQRHHGLARSHVPLKQPVHRAGDGHVLFDLFDRAPLGRGRFERQGGQEPPGQRALGHVGHSDRVAFDPVLPKGHAELQGEQLVELEPADRDRPAARALGEVDLPERAVLRLEVLGRDDLAGKRVSDRTDPVERPMHELADRARRDPFRGSVDGDDPAGVYQVRL